MDETELALERLSDTSAFETLAVVYMERRWPELRGMIQTGINPEGKPVVCPVDALRTIPIGDGTQKLALLAATTTADEELPRKWLGEESTTRGGRKRKHEPRKGDIEKAAMVLTGCKKTHPQTRGTLYLATNRRPAVALVQSSSARALQLGLDGLEIIKASALLRFLNIDPDGQYVRRTILNVPAERLSALLLADICRESLTQHAARFPPTHTGTWAVERDVSAGLADLLAHPGPRQIALQGPSGFGKSVLLRQAGEQILQTGGVALWVPAEQLEAGHSPEDVVLRVLRQHRPDLGDRVGAEALELAAARPGGFVLLVDDVNRLARPDRSLEKVREFAGANSQCRWLVPVWPGQVKDDRLAADGGERPAWYTLDVGRYSPTERAQFAAWVPPALCDVVDGDPFLCALVPEDARFDWGPTRSEVLRQVIERLIERATRDAAAERRASGTAADFAATLDDLVVCVLHLDEPEPAWAQVRAELGEQATDRLAVLSERSRLGWVEGGPDRRWRWTHDRLRDFIIGHWLAREILSRGRELTGEQNVLLHHPGLAEAWAVAAACVPPGGERRQALECLREAQPVALAKLLQFRLFPDEEAEREIIRQGLTAALAASEPRVQTVIDPAPSAALWTLILTDDLLVCRIVQEDSNGPWDLVARFRNGDINAGLWFVRNMSHQFLPAVRFRHFESAVSAFGRVFDGRRESLVEAVQGALGDDADMARSVLVLAGYLGWPEWATFARELWRRLTPAEKDQSWREAIWAIARTSATDAPPELEEAVLRACELVEAETQSRAIVSGDVMAEGWSVHEEFTHVWPRWPVTRATARLFARLVTEYPGRAHLIHRLALGIDTPETVEAVFRAAPVALSGGDSMDPLGNRESQEPFPRNPDTRTRLWELSRTEPEVWARRRAFRLWREAMSVADLPWLQEVPMSDALFDDVLAARLRLRDASAAPLLIERMNTDPVCWCSFAPAVYGEQGVEEAFDRNLEAAFSGDGWRAPVSVALHLNPEQVRRLIARHGAVLERHPRSWPALWRSDVPEALEFVRRAIERAPAASVKRFFMVGGWPYPVSTRMLNSLRPVLDRFSQDDLASWLGLLALRAGCIDWVQENIVPRVQDRNGPWLDRAGARNLLEQGAAAVSQGERAVMRSGVFQLAYERGDLLFESAIVVLREWLEATPRPEQVVVSALILERVGSGADWDWWQGLAVPPGQEVLWERVGWLLRRWRWQPVIGTGD